MSKNLAKTIKTTEDKSNEKAQPAKQHYGSNRLSDRAFKKQMLCVKMGEVRRRK